MAKKSKRVLSVLLTLVMILGLLPTSVFAYEQDQVVSNGQEVTEADGRVVHSKMINQTGENKFEITLTAKTKEEIQEQVVSQDAAVVLVLDVSNSMDDEVKGSQKITQAKAAAKDFVDSFVKDAGEGSRMVSIVEFGANAKTVSDWTEANGNAGAVKDSIDEVEIKFDYTVRCNKNYLHRHGWDWYRGAHDMTVKDDGGTNIEGGLRLANNLLKSSAVADIENTYVVLLTDGVPTYHVSDGDETSSTTFMAGTIRITTISTALNRGGTMSSMATTFPSRSRIRGPSCTPWPMT